MLNEIQEREVEPGLRQYELDCAIHNVGEKAYESGFIVAWQSTRRGPLGFNFITREAGHLVAIRARAEDFKQRLQFETSHIRGPKANDDFIVAFMQSLAKETGADYVTVANHLASERSLWRFMCLIDGEFSNRWPDNGFAWQALWGRVIEVDDRAVASVPAEVREGVRRRLHGFAVEGQIVLDR